MSKITSKNLHYDTTLPPFLARLQANKNARDGRHEYTIARATKKRSAEEEAEDEPVYFNEESGETLTKGEWEEREKFSGEGQVLKETEGEKENEEGEVKSKEKEKEKERVAAIGAGKKRKGGKVVGGDEDEIEEKERANSALGKAIAAAKSTTASKPEEKKPEKGKTKTAKKGKKVKLSFDD